MKKTPTLLKSRFLEKNCGLLRIYKLCTPLGSQSLADFENVQQILEINQLWYCLVFTVQTVFLSSFKHLSSKHCNLFYWKLICESITDPDLLWICFVSGWFRKCNWKEHRSGNIKVGLFKKNCKNVMIWKRFFVNWLHIFKMKKLRHVESDKLSAGYFYFGLNAQKQKKGWGTGHMSPF